MVALGRDFLGFGNLPSRSAAAVVAVDDCRNAVPPDHETKDWQARLNKALGTVSPDFVKASLLQVQAAARSPYGTISETAINSALARGR